MSESKNTFNFIDEKGQVRTAKEIFIFHLLDTSKDYVIYELSYDNQDIASIHVGIIEKTNNDIKISDIADVQELELVMKSIKNMALEGDR